MAWIPPLVLLVLAAFAGTFETGSSALGAALGLILLPVCLLTGLQPDPWRLGRAGRVLPWALVAVVVAAWWASPVPRAGLFAVWLLPAWLLWPAAVARCWDDPGDRRRGILGVAAVVLGIAGWSLWSWWTLWSEGVEGARPALPLGHHNLLAAWLVAVAPLLLPYALYRYEFGRFHRWLRWLRWLPAAALVASAAAWLGTRSLGGWAGGLAALAVWWLLRRGTDRRWVAGAAAGLALLGAALIFVAGPRLADVALGDDLSARARLGYAEAGWRGLMERPALGWGPGSTPWTVAEHLRPDPGVRPPAEVVGQLHSLPVELAYELGLTGLLVVLGLIAAVGLALRARGGRGASPTGQAAVAALVGSAVAALANGGLSVTAVPAAWGLALGTALAVRRPDSALPPLSARTERASRPLTIVYVVFALVAVVPLLRAQLHYERAVDAPALDVARRHLVEAVGLDPRFPLYRARLAWLDERATEAREAAEAAYGVAPLWLEAGALGREAEAPWAGRALRRACELDPLFPFAAFWLTGPEVRSPTLLARALLLEPRLLAAVDPERLDAARRLRVEEALGNWEGVDLGLRDELVQLWRQPLPASGDLAQLAARLEGRADQLFAPTVFRRAAWFARLAAVPVDAGRARYVDLPPAGELPSTTDGAFAACTAAE